MIIAFEGLDGCGKSTQINLLKDYLDSLHIKVSVCDWRRGKNIVKLVQRMAKSNDTFRRDGSLVFASEFWRICDDQNERIKSTNEIIIFDRYIYTEIARGIARGLNADWLNMLYNDAPIPNITFFMDCSLPIILNRKKDKDISFFEAGLDADLCSNDSYYNLYIDYNSGKISKHKLNKAFESFQEKQLKAYKSLKSFNDFCIIDTYELDIVQIHKLILNEVNQELFMKFEKGRELFV